MKEMNEQQMDMLIAETLKRQHIVEKIGKNIMAEVRRAERRKKIAYWKHAVVFSFALPLVVVAFGLLMYRYVFAATEGALSTVCTVIPAVAMLYYISLIVKNFSADDGVINSKVTGLIDESKKQRIITI